MNWKEVSARKYKNFIIGRDDFSNLEIDSTRIDSFYYIKDKGDNSIIRQFILEDLKTIYRVCEVTLIKSGKKFTPRLSFSIRSKKDNKILEKDVKITKDTANLKARVGLKDCHKNFWKLISFLKTLKDINIPEDKFSLFDKNESDIVEALKSKDKKSISNIVKRLIDEEDLDLSSKDINILLNRRKILSEFENGLDKFKDNENYWQEYFENNKWIFGYGLNYQILKQEQSQPNYGGTGLDGKGGQRGDYLTSTSGIIGFTVLVEIKTPNTPLLAGSSEIRNGAWSLSKDLSDSIAQLQANIQTWDKEGSDKPNNRDRLEAENKYTVKPKGVIVIGSLKEVRDNRNKRETFERFRNSISGIEILTFDELYERAKFIVNSNE